VPTRLKKLRINRIDLVDKGAAPDARIALYKRQEPLHKNDDYDGGDYTPQTVEEILAQRDAKEAWWELTGALEMSVRSIMEAPTGKVAPLARPAVCAVVDPGQLSVPTGAV